MDYKKNKTKQTTLDVCINRQSGLSHRQTSQTFQKSAEHLLISEKWFRSRFLDLKNDKVVSKAEKQKQLPHRLAFGTGDFLISSSSILVLLSRSQDVTADSQRPGKREVTQTKIFYFFKKRWRKVLYKIHYSQNVCDSRRKTPTLSRF